MLFFKYQKPGNLEFTMLRRGEIYFAAPSELNDPSECRPTFLFQGNETLWICLIDKIFGLLLEDDEIVRLLSQTETDILTHKSADVAHFIYEDGALELKLDDVRCLILSAVYGLYSLDHFNSSVPSGIDKVFEHSLPEILEEDKYICSFSTNATNPTMWGHYGGAERGFALVFESRQKSLEICSNTKVLTSGKLTRSGVCDLHEVTYRDVPPKFNGFHGIARAGGSAYQLPVSVLKNDFDHGKAFSPIGLVKYRDWRYECEIRAFLPTFSELLPEERIARFSAKQFRGIIFGPMMSESDKKRICLCCENLRETIYQGEDYPEPFAIFQAYRTEAAFLLSVTSLGTTNDFDFESMSRSHREITDAGHNEELEALAREIEDCGVPPTFAEG